jgi:hypothetical protein
MTDNNNNNKKPDFQEIVSLIPQLPDYSPFNSQALSPLQWLTEWLEQYSQTMDFSRGFLVNRCALYWTAYDTVDGFDGQNFVDSCEDANGSLRQLAQILDTDLQIFELDPTNTAKPTLDELAMAASYGMMAIEEGTQLFCACSFGQGVSISAADALENTDDFQDIESFMNKYCGLDHAAMLGSLIACLLKGIPAIVEGTTGKLIKTLLEKQTGQSWDSIIIAEELNLPINHYTPGHQMIMAAIILKTLYTGNIKTDCGKLKDAA